MFGKRKLRLLKLVDQVVTARVQEQEERILLLEKALSNVIKRLEIEDIIKESKK